MFRKLGFILFSTVLFLGTAIPARAESSDWEITSFDSQLKILANGKVAISEKIQVDFYANEKHGIFRDIPYLYSTANGQIYTEVIIGSVKRDGNVEPYELTKTDSHIRLKIGSAEQTIIGQHVYEISYEVAGVISRYENFDELYWNVTGNEWDAPILRSSAVVQLPTNGIVQQACYQGFAGSQTPCEDQSLTESTANFTHSNPLNPGTGLTIAVGIEKGVVPILTPHKPKEPFELLISELAKPTYGVLLIFAAILGMAAPIWWWWKKGRDWWWQNPAILGSNQKAWLKPLNRKPQIVVEFEPPLELRPAQIGVLLDQKADTINVTSTIIDLASRGYMLIKELDKTWAFGSHDYQLTLTKKSQADLLSYEQTLLDRMFGAKSEIKLSSLKNTFFDDLAKIKDSIYADLMHRGYFTSNPKQVRYTYIGIGLALVVMSGGLTWLSFVLIWAWLLVAALLLTLAGLTTLIVSMAMPQRTALGFELYRRALGYKLFISTAEKYRQRFFESQNVFTQVLPYAMMFGLTDKLAKALQQIGYQPSQPTWYSGIHAFNINQFSRDMGSVTKALSSTMASAPSGSGSGGGGSSGGGFGGGGGGSW